MTANLLQRTSEVHGEQMLYHFGNGLVVRTEHPGVKSPLRVLGLGSPQNTLLNYMLNFPETIRNKEVFEPFAGSGVLGLMALKVGAAYAEFLDINPRAVEFQRANAHLNDLTPDQFTCHEGDINTFVPERKFDLLFANPPFVPTPEGIKGLITSNGGAEGNTLVQVLLARLEDFLKPTGESLLYVFQLVHEGTPLVSDVVARLMKRRAMAITCAQESPIPFALYVQTYCEVFPQFPEEIRRWQSDLLTRFKGDLGLSHYVVHIGPQHQQSTVVKMADDFADTFGDELLMRSDLKDLARVRIRENVL